MDTRSPLPSALDPAVPSALLAALDGLALVAFVLVGMRSHHEATAAEVFARNAIPLLVCWFAVAGLTHTYRRGQGTWGFLRTWAIAVPVALLVRTWIVGSPSTPGRIALFVGVGMTFTLAFLLVVRVAVRLVTRAMRRTA
jgi:uncharacterized membrane protein